MKVQPLKTKVLVAPIEMETKTAGGIYIPENAKEKTHEGTVVEIGESKDIAVKVGDRIIYEGFSGTEIKINNKKHLILDAKDILAVVK